MTEGVDAAALLERFGAMPTTVWFIERPTRSVGASWNESKHFSSLRSAMQAVERDGGKHAYDILIHEPGRDRPLTRDEFAALHAFFTSDQGKRPEDLDASNDD